MCESGVEGFRRNYPRYRRQLERNFIKHQNLVEADLNVLIKFRNNVNPAHGPGNVQRLIVLLFRDFPLQDSLQTELGRNVFLSRRVRFVSNRRKERFVDDLGG